MKILILSSLIFGPVLAMQRYDIETKEIQPLDFNRLFVQTVDKRVTANQVKAKKLLQTLLKEVYADFLSEISAVVQKQINPLDLYDPDLNKTIKEKLSSIEPTQSQKIRMLCKVIAFIATLKKNITKHIDCDQLKPALADKNNLDLPLIIALCTNFLISKEEAGEIISKENAHDYFRVYLDEKDQNFIEAVITLLTVEKLFADYVKKLKELRLPIHNKTHHTLQQAFYFVNLQLLKGEQINECYRAITQLKDLKPISAKARVSLAKEKDLKQSTKICQALHFLPLDPLRTLNSLLEAEIKEALALIAQYRDTETDERRRKAFICILDIGNNIWKETFDLHQEFVAISPKLTGFVKIVKTTSNPYLILHSIDQEYKMKFCHYCMKEASKDLKLCSKCKTNRYCSQNCQLADWHEEHKEWCKLLSTCSPIFDGLAQLNINFEINSSEDLSFEYFANILLAEPNQ